MNVKRKVAAVGLTLLMVTSMLPAGMVGTAEAQSASSTYTVIQGSNCWEVEPYEPYDNNPDGPGGVQPHVEIITHSEEGGDFRNSSWDGSPTIESVMDYRFRDPEGGVHGDEQAQPWGPRPHQSPWLSEFYRKEGWEYGTYGLWNWSENQESHMFFYSGPEGDSVVMRHDKLYDGVAEGSKDPYNGLNGPQSGYMSPQPGGGAVSFVFRDLPAGEWAYMDDLYPENMDAIYYASGEFEYDPDRHTRYGTRHNNYDAAPLGNYDGGTDFTAHWMWHDNGTDGGAYRGLHNLGPGESITIEPYFDERSYFWQNTNYYDRDEGDGITDWVIRRPGEDNDITLDKTEPVEIRRGSHCPDASLATSHGGSPEVGANVTFTAGEESSGATYSWDFDGDGTPERNTSSASVSHGFNSSGERTVSVTVETSDGIQDSDSMAVEVVPSQPPTAQLSVEPGDRGLDEHHIVGEQLTLNASASTDNSGAIAEYHWDFGDGVNTTGGAQVGYSYDEAGTYEVTVTVTDPAGNTDAATYAVEIEEPDEEAPTARGEATSEVEAGAPLTLDASDSGDNRGIVEYQWDFNGDGTFTETTPNATLNLDSEPYGAAGTYNATLRVVDGSGNTNTTTVPVTVTEAEPPEINDVTVTDQVSAGEEFDVSVDAEDESGIASVTYEFSDGASRTVEGDGSVTHAFENAGDAWVSVTVRDRAGYENATAEPIPINVTQEPAAALSLSTNGTAPNGTETGETVTFDASGSDDLDGDIVEYRWDFDGDGDVDDTTNTSENVVTHAYDSGGTYTAEVTVEDDSGLTDTATAEIEIEQDEQAIDNSGSSGSTGGSVNVGPPPVDKETEQTGPNSAAVDVRNARGDETIRTDLPETEVAGETGVTFERLAVDLPSDNPHVVFETAASADRPDGVGELTATHETLAYLELDGKYLSGGVENATVEFAVEKSALGGLAEADDVVVYQHDGGAWTQVDAEVRDENEDGFQLAATTDSLGTLAVGTDQSLAVADAGLETDEVATGETLTANVTIENDGETAETGTVELAFDGNVVASETVEVAPGETTEVTLRGTAPATGTYEATVGGVSLGEVEVLETRPADVSVADVSVNESTIAAGEQVAITATVENTGGETGEQNVSLTLFGEELDSETVRVEGGETEEVTFVRQIDAAGTYTAEIGGETVEIQVTESEDDGLASDAPDVPGFGVGAALVALLAAALLARLRN